MQRIPNFVWKAASALLLVMLAVGVWASPELRADAQAVSPVASAATPVPAAQAAGRVVGARALPPIQAHEFNGDVRDLPAVPSTPSFRTKLAPQLSSKTATAAGPAALAVADAPVAPNMPAPLASFEGLAFSNTCTGGRCGAGYPPDPVGDVGPNHYVEAVNTAVGIFSKTGAQLAAFTFNSFWSVAGTGTVCDTGHQGDPTVVYDHLADRWIVSDFAFASGGTTPPFYECIAVSKTGNPVTGGWYFFALRADDATHAWLNDYPKMGLWPDGIYMTANEFLNGQTFAGVRLWAINRSQLESGTLNVQMLDLGTNLFSLLPANLRGAAPPAGSPAYLAGENINSPNAFSYDVYTLRVNWTTPANTVFSGPFQVAQAAYGPPWSGSGATYTSDIIPQPGTGTLLDAIDDRFMMQLQYRNLGGTESLWLAHTVRPAGATSGPTGIQWAQLDVTGGTIRSTPVQQQIFTNGSDGLYRWIPSIAVDANGDAAVGYSVSGSATFPSIRWAGRLAGDPLGTLGQGEGILLAGTGSQNFNCGGAACSRWGDYSAMTVDPVDDCTFWYVNEYYASTGNTSWQTRIGSFKFPSCGTGPTLTPRLYLPMLMH